MEGFARRFRWPRWPKAGGANEDKRPGPRTDRGQRPGYRIRAAEARRRRAEVVAGGEALAATRPRSRRDREPDEDPSE